jgi:hypothetical protein
MNALLPPEPTLLHILITLLLRAGVSILVVIVSLLPVYCESSLPAILGSLPLP